MVKVLRWICEKCNKKWIHPVKKCIYCNDDIKKQIGTKTKVIGVSKVNVPSLLHPITPYHVLILEDEYGNKMPKKTIKEYNIGDIYENIPDTSESAIAAVKIKYDYDEAVTEAIELIGGLDVDENKKILIKPNLSIPGYSYLGLTTNPRVIDSLIKHLLSKGVKKENITLAEQSFFVPMEKAASKTGLTQLIEKYGINFIDISKTEFVEKEAREFKLHVSKIIDDFDLIINMPVIKTDMILGMDGAFENLTRFLKKEDFDELAKDPMKAVGALAVLPTLFPKFITIGDGSIGEQGNGPAMYGRPGFFDLIFAARNPVVHDKAVQEVLCLRKLPYVELAGKVGQGEYDISKIKFIGNELDALRRDIEHPIGSKLIKKN